VFTKEIDHAGVPPLGCKHVGGASDLRGGRSLAVPGIDVCALFDEYPGCLWTSERRREEQVCRVTLFVLG
jgi:hypothetical protein